MIVFLRKMGSVSLKHKSFQMSQLTIITFALITEINGNSKYLVFLHSCVCLPLT